MAYKKVGGLHFFTLGRFGLTFYIKKHRYSHITADAIGRAAKRMQRNAALRGELLHEVTSHPASDPFLPRSFNPYFER